MSFPAIAIGGHLSVSVGDRVVRGVWRRAPSGEQASKPLSDSRQQPFCNFVSKVVRGAGKGPQQTVEVGMKPRNSRVLPPTVKMPRLYLCDDPPTEPRAERANPCADRPSVIDSIVDSIDRDRDFGFLPMIERPIPSPDCPSRRRFACASCFDSIEGVANLAGSIANYGARSPISAIRSIGAAEVRPRLATVLYIERCKGPLGLALIKPRACPGGLRLMTLYSRASPQPRPRSGRYDI